ncbi:hypothetical protein GE061_018370 [Apolygus lucorum]|uniref:Peptidase S1 domain-containing protein n=1 Tax=Apolygus lucorum TaxID=248454 RepID=A0A8S9XFQ7_APOLU|nr:hypothetical protein GE061_018370 [Apolygus lucorum]
MTRSKYNIIFGGSDDSIRVKRVISGTSVVDLNSEYKAVRYFVWLGDGERCDALSIEDVKKFLELEDKNSLTAPFASCAPNTETAFCGGSLLTSTIVQTACHCLVTFEGVKDGFQLPVTHRVWENMYDVYPGAVPVKMASGVKSRHYIRHPKCTQHFETGKVLHDYALIVLRSPLLAKKILHAPVYTINALTQIWTESMAKRAICMELGFGRYRLTDTNEPEPSRSEFLRHGWVRTMDYEWCYNRSSLPAKFKEGRWNYSQDATWLCTRTLPGRGQHHAPGDSGSPTTCNNQSSIPCVITTQYNFCGGSLLTPKLVQTACHCLAYFTTEKDGFKSAVTKDVFENELMVYPGIVPPDIVDGVKSEKFFSHPKCKQYTSSKLALHDYGLIVLASELFERRVVPAPVYTIRTLTRVWTETMAKEAACLLLGYGRYRLLDDDHEDPTLPNVILHGWVRSMPYRDCYLYTTSDYTDAKKKWNYTDEATYFCMEALPTFNQYQGGGDSGGPVSCNNQYAGIVSYVRYKDKPRALQVSAAMSTAFSVYENSAEYRKSMLEANLGQDHLSKFDNIRPTSQPLHQYFYDRF